ncbi:hypothetical protein [uncultured Ruegeria sp.]|uniref:hypothetical protein n=1 Tax=uncultured Ruegeria sp. TaxID=259304 RepID=UPI002630DC76|nr:hypothetical protein [uncultured Ruegeria sp.]
MVESLKEKIATRKANSLRRRQVRAERQGEMPALTAPEQRLAHLQNAVNGAEAAQQLDNTDGLLNAAAATPDFSEKVVTSASEPVFAPGPHNTYAIVRRLPRGAQVTATRPLVAIRSGQPLLYSRIEGTDEIIRAKALSDTSAVALGETHGIDALKAGMEGTEGADTAAGMHDRGALKESDGSGFKVDKPAERIDERDWDFKHGSEAMAGATGSIADIIAIGSLIRNWRTRNTGEKFGDAIEIGASTTSLGANVAKVVDSSAKAHDGRGTGGTGGATSISGGRQGSYATTHSDAAGKITGNIGDFAGLIASVKDLVLSTRDAIKTCMAKQESSRGEKRRGIAQALLDFLKLAKGAASTARNLQFTLENAFSVAASTAVPILGLLVTGLQAVIHAYHVGTSLADFKTMQERKRDLKSQLGGAVDAEAVAIQQDENVSRQGGAEGIEDQWSFAGKVLHKGVNAIDHRGIEALLEREKENLERIAEDPAHGHEIVARKKVIALIERYQIARAFQQVNAKTARRGLANLGLDLTSIAGDIATLTGVGAGAGGGLKIAAGAGKAAMVVTRHLKQFGRNKAATNARWARVFNADKSSEKKLEQRRHIADLLFAQIGRLYTNIKQHNGPLSNEMRSNFNKQFHEVSWYVRAGGLSWKAWVAVCKRDPAKGYDMIVEGQKTRG